MRNSDLVTLMLVIIVFNCLLALSETTKILPLGMDVVNQGSVDTNDTSDKLTLVPGSCTIFSASYSNTVLFGNNEDYNKDACPVEGGFRQSAG